MQKRLPHISELFFSAAVWCLVAVFIKGEECFRFASVSKRTRERKTRGGSNRVKSSLSLSLSSVSPSFCRAVGSPLLIPYYTAFACSSRPHWLVGTPERELLPNLCKHNPYLASFSSGAKRGLLLLYEVYPTGRGVKLLVKLVKNRMFS